MRAFTPKSTTKTPQAKPERKRPRSGDGWSAEAAALRASVFVDNRPEAIAQRKLQAMVEKSPQVQRLAQLQAMVDNSPRQVAQPQQLDRLLGQPVQRREGTGEDELQMQAKPGMPQRQSLEDEELLQGKIEPVQRHGLEDGNLLQGRFASSETPTQLQAVEDAIANHTGMPDQLKAGLEQLSGMDLSGVRVHYHSSKPAQLNALAYVQGQDIHLGSGQERHLPHEGWHAVQQMQGRVKPTIQAQGVPINDDTALEHEADVMGAKAMQMRRPDQVATRPTVQATTPKPHERAQTEASQEKNRAIVQRFVKIPEDQKAQLTNEIQSDIDTYNKALSAWFRARTEENFDTLFSKHYALLFMVQFDTDTNATFAEIERQLQRDESHLALKEYGSAKARMDRMIESIKLGVPPEYYWVP